MGGQQNLPHYSKHHWQNKLQFESLRVITGPASFQLLSVCLSVCTGWVHVWSTFWAFNTHIVCQGCVGRHNCVKAVTSIAFGFKINPPCHSWTLAAKMTQWIWMMHSQMMTGRLRCHTVRDISSNFLCLRQFFSFFWLNTRFKAAW